MTTFYNEIEPYAVEWLRNLIDADAIADGEVDVRPIEELVASDLDGSVQAHFFAGIGVWSYALRLAGWPDDLPVWTGSCPCQPFSNSGRLLREDDPRHLWPKWAPLIRQCRPPVVFGEQVASPAGRAWLAAVRAEMEEMGYAFGAADLCAAGVGAPHLRQRLFFGAFRLVHPDNTRLEGRGQLRNGANQRAAGPSSVAGFWGDSDWLPCRDGKLRPVEPGTSPLVDGTSASMAGRLAGYGNAIVPQVAAAFIQSFMEATVEALP